MSKLLFLESSDIGVRYSGEGAKALGYEPVFLCDLAGFRGDPGQQLLAYPHFDCDTRSVAGITDFLGKHSIHDIAAVTTFADSRLKVASELARTLQVAGLDPAVGLLKDKGTVARFIPEFSPESVVVGPGDVPTERLEAMLRKHDRLIVKPSEGAGGAGIFYLRSRDDIDDLVSKAASAPPFFSWVVQQLVDGPLVSAEGYVRQGQARVLGFSGRRKIGATETGADFPIDDRIPPEVRSRALASIAALVDRSGFRNGYFHIEFLCTQETCLLIDANIGRIGGGAIAEQLAIAYGVRPEQVFEHVMELSLFGFEQPHLYRRVEAPRETYAILYGLPQGGKVERVCVPENSRCFHTQIIPNGGEVSPLGKDDWSWIGILSGETADTLAAIEKLRIQSNGIEYRPQY